MNHLPTDEEFLEHVYAVSKDDSYIAETSRAYKDALDCNGRFAAAVAAGLFQPNEIESFRKLDQESSSLDNAFRGQFINALKNMALKVAETDRERLAGIPIGLLPTRELNACVIATPRRGAIIILNHGVIGQLAYICRCALSFISWHSDSPFC